MQHTYNFLQLRECLGDQYEQKRLTLDELAAQQNPDQYRNLQIRVCGWNVYFVDLEKVLQDKFIKWCEHQEGLGV